jgi:small-conductance mechanosensitive channel
MTLFNSWYYSFSPTLATGMQAHPTQRAAFRAVLYPLLGILYASYYSYLLLAPVSDEVAAVFAGIVAAGLIGLVYLAPTAYLALRIMRRRFRSIGIRSFRLVVLTAASVVLTWITYLTGQAVYLGIVTAILVLLTMSLGCILGTVALTVLEPAYTRLPAAWVVSLIKRSPPIDRKAL